jgi:hypothetical protein
MHRAALLSLVIVTACAARARTHVEQPSPRVGAAVVPGERPAPSTQPPEASGDRVLLAVTGYGVSRDDVALADLAAGYCAGTIKVDAAARAVADARFGCAGTPIASLDELLPKAKTALAITNLDHVTARWRALRVDGVPFFEKPGEYALVVDREPGARADFAPHLAHFIMTGVTAITRATGAACDDHGIDWLTENLRDHFDRADYVHVSNEVSIVGDCKYPVKGTYSFCSKERDFKALLDLHVNVVELTGNHNRDFGDEPFKRTMAWYREHEMTTFGAGLSPEEANVPAIVPLKDGKKLGLVGFNESCPLKECAKKPAEVGANAYTPAKAKAAIASMRELGADVVMVTVQFRERDGTDPTPSQNKIAHDLVEWGADLVYGSQGHEPQLVEFYRGKPIFYGIGNFLFDQIHRVPVRQGFFLHHYFFHGRLVQSVPVFTFMAASRQPTLATPEQADAVRAVIFRDALLYK